MSEMTSKIKKSNAKRKWSECCRHVYETMTPNEFRYENDNQFKLKKANWEKAFKRLIQDYSRID